MQQIESCKCIMHHVSDCMESQFLLYFFILLQLVLFVKLNILSKSDRKGRKSGVTLFNLDPDVLTSYATQFGDDGRSEPNNTCDAPAPQGVFSPEASSDAAAPGDQLSSESISGKPCMYCTWSSTQVNVNTYTEVSSMV